MTFGLLKLFIRLSGILENARADATGGGVTGDGLTLTNPLCGGDPNCTFADVAVSVINFLYDISIPLVAIMVLVGGFQMIMAGGKPEEFSKGKKTIMYAVIGFAAVLIAKGVASIIQSLFGAPAT